MRLAASIVLVALACGAAHGKQPEQPTRGDAAAGDKAMIAAANPQAVEAGLAILRRGGNAIDAAVAVQATLGLVEPQSSGVGGGAFILWYDPRTRTVTAYDGREKAPAGAAPTMFLRPDGKPMTYAEAVLSGRSAGVPGAIAALHMAQTERGKLPWASLFAGTERLAEEGFTVGPRLQGMVTSARAPQAKAPDVIAYFRGPDGAPIRAGERLRNPAYAATLRLIAAEGPDAILKGKVAADIVARLA